MDRFCRQKQALSTKIRILKDKTRIWKVIIVPNFPTHPFRSQKCQNSRFFIPKYLKCEKKYFALSTRLANESGGQAPGITARSITTNNEGICTDLTLYYKVRSIFKIMETKNTTKNNIVGK